MSLRQIFVRTKRTIGTIQLDGVLSEDHDNTVTITKSPVEAGTDITDHAILQPKKLIVRGIVSDSPLGLAAFGQLIDQVTRLFGTSTLDNLTRSQQAYEAFLRLMEVREPIEVVTGLRVYEDMLITSITTSQDKDTARASVLNIGLEEIILTESVLVSIPQDAIDASVQQSATSIGDRGKVEVEEILDERETTILKSLVEWTRESL